MAIGGETFADDSAFQYMSAAKSVRGAMAHINRECMVPRPSSDFLGQARLEVRSKGPLNLRISSTDRAPAHEKEDVVHMTHDYVRHGTTTLFAALNVLEGTSSANVSAAIAMRSP